ncbi:GNAT family N-acetyltransferase [Streptomyces sp. NPDC002588]|uniref:GNAT family N-acetyltransferase n=1 Tax=Streptomyces sp. NPDC002588 TaxID=3154419 RepID=UPI003321DBFC
MPTPPTPSVPPVTLRAAATPTAPALVLRPWRPTDVPALIEAHRDPVLRRWISSPVDDEADGERWVESQEQGWAAGTRFGFAVLEERPGTGEGRLAGHLVLKEVSSGNPAAEVGYWTAAHARGRGVAPRALLTLTDWAHDTFADAGLTRLELIHQVDNLASCRVAEKTGYAFAAVLPAMPPAYPLDGHLHVCHMPSPLRHG